jgi:hypothetical protein
MLAMWFVVSVVVAPASMSASMMGMSGMSMQDMPGMSMQDMPGMSMQDMPGQGMSGNGMSSDGMSGSAVTSAATSNKVPDKKSDTPSCEHHDCCCSALSLLLSTPQSAIAWVPEHIIGKATPYFVNNVSHTEGQLLLPFANGPPKTVQG